jgi:hypothetical protein
MAEGRHGKVMAKGQLGGSAMVEGRRDEVTA